MLRIGIRPRWAVDAERPRRAARPCYRCERWCGCERKLSEPTVAKRRRRRRASAARDALTNPEVPETADPQPEGDMALQRASNVSVELLEIRSAWPLWRRTGFGKLLGIAYLESRGLSTLSGGGWLEPIEHPERPSSTETMNAYLIAHRYSNRAPTTRSKPPHVNNHRAMDRRLPHLYVVRAADT